MPTYYAKKPSSEAMPQEGENWLVYFGGSTIEDCENALLVADDGEIILLRTVRQVSRDELDRLDFENWTSEDYKKWEDLFGKGAASNELRTTYRHFRKVNEQL